MLSFKTSFLVFVCVATSVIAAPISIQRREVPQEHSHEPFLTSVRANLNLNNPLNLGDPVFSLLGNAAAAQGLGDTTDPECLQQEVSDQAFTNAKAAGDVQGQVDALIFRALERNTGSVGQASNLCTSVTATNPEIAAIQQHQDPASNGAADVNKSIVLELARQIAAVGGDPQDALKSGTFAPGNIGDTTGAGNTCDDANDLDGCIFTQGLLVEDATAAEIDAAVAGVGAGTANNASNDAATGNDNAATCAPAATVTVTAAASAATADKTANNASNASTGDGKATSAGKGTTAAAATAGNLQTFTGALGGATAPAVTAGGRGFEVAGSDDFLNSGAALGRSCDIQHNACANAANSGSADISVGDCDAQLTKCRAAI